MIDDIKSIFIGLIVMGILWVIALIAVNCEIFFNIIEIIVILIIALHVGMIVRYVIMER
jgi:hypothetical protein